jgi:hypothetical protein
MAETHRAGESARSRTRKDSAAGNVSSRLTLSRSCQRVICARYLVRANKGGLCRKISRSGDREDPVLIQRCPAGPGGWPVTMVSGDARVYVSFGREARAGATVMDALNGEFADPNSVVEWRLRDGRPYAAIQRYFLDRKQVLTVHRLNDDGSSCVAAVVAVERGHDANAEAARIADDMVPVFRCGVDKLITTARGPLTPNQASLPELRAMEQPARRPARTVIPEWAEGRAGFAARVVPRTRAALRLSLLMGAHARDQRRRYAVELLGTLVPCRLLNSEL